MAKISRVAIMEAGRKFSVQSKRAIARSSSELF